MKNIVINNLEKKYNELSLFLIKEKEFDQKMYLLSGSNGVGKSVFLKCLLNLEESFQRDISIKGDNILYLTDTPQVLPYLSIIDNIKFLLYLHGVTLNDTKLTNIFTQSQLKTMSSQSSLGMNIKVGLSLILVSNHWDLIVLDETLSNIDKDSTIFLEKELKKRSTEKTCIIVVDHNISSNNYSKITLKEGRLIFND